MRSMRRGRGRIVELQEPVINEPVVSNPQSETSFSIQNLVIGPGQSVRVSQEVLDNESMRKWLAQGLLTIEKPAKPMMRYIGNRPMRIIHFVHTLFGGGAERSTLELHKAMRKFNVTQWLVNLYVGGEEERMLSADAAEIFDFVYECPIDGWGTPKTGRLVMDILKEYDPDLVIYANIDSIPKFVHQRVPRPPIVQVQHSELDGTIRAYKPGLVDAVVTVSEAMARNRIRDSRIPAEDVFPIWNGVEPARVTAGQSLRDKLGIPQDAFVLGMVGNLNDLKRPDLAVEALTDCRRENIHLLLSGNPQDEARVRGRADGLGVFERVHILGYRTDVHNVYATLDVMLNCSTSEGLPMTIVEAMFNSLPVIATAVGGNQEVVLHGVTGYLYDVNDQRSLVDYICALHDGKRLRARMGKAGCQRANEYFHIDVAAQSYWDLFSTFVTAASEPRCSVVMPAYNAAESVVASIDSVLHQTMPYFELIIVNDGSDDNTLALVREKAAMDDRIRVVHQPHTGIVGALNHGISEACTDIIARIDADDEMAPSRLEKQLEFLEGRSDVDILGSNMICRRMRDKSVINVTQLPVEHGDIVEMMKSANALGHPSVAFRKRVWQAAGGYRGDGRAEDYKLWTDAIVMGFRVHNLEEPLTIYGVGENKTPEYKQWVQSTDAEMQEQFKAKMECRGMYERPLGIMPLSGGGV